MINLGTLMTVFTADNSKFASTVDDTSRRLLGLERRANKSVGELARVGVQLGAIFSSYKIATSIANAGQEMDGFHRRLSIMTRSLVAANVKGFENADVATKIAEEYQWLKKTALQTGSAFDELNKAYTRLLPMAAANNIEIGKIKEVIIGTIGAGNVMGASTQEMKRAFIALGQIVGKNALQMEELRQQLGEALPNAMIIAASGLTEYRKELQAAGKFTGDTNVTLGKLFALIQRGEIDGKTFIEMWVRGTAEFRKFAEAGGGTFAGQLENLRTIFKTGVGDFMLKSQLQDRLTAGIALFNDWLNRLLTMTDAKTREIGDKISSIFKDFVDIGDTALGSLTVIFGVIKNGIDAIYGDIKSILGQLPDEVKEYGLLGLLLFGPKGRLILGIMAGLTAIDLGKKLGTMIGTDIADQRSTSLTEKYGPGGLPQGYRKLTPDNTKDYSKQLADMLSADRAYAHEIQKLLGKTFLDQFADADSEQRAKLWENKRLAVIARGEELAAKLREVEAKIKNPQKDGSAQANFKLRDDINAELQTIKEALSLIGRWGGAIDRAAIDFKGGGVKLAESVKGAEKQYTGAMEGWFDATELAMSKWDKKTREFSEMREEIMKRIVPINPQDSTKLSTLGPTKLIKLYDDMAKMISSSGLGKAMGKEDMSKLAQMGVINFFDAWTREFEKNKSNLDLFKELAEKDPGFKELFAQYGAGMDENAVQAMSLMVVVSQFAKSAIGGTVEEVANAAAKGEAVFEETIKRLEEIAAKNPHLKMMIEAMKLVAIEQKKIFQGRVAASRNKAGRDAEQAAMDKLNRALQRAQSLYQSQDNALDAIVMKEHRAAEFAAQRAVEQGKLKFGKIDKEGLVFSLTRDQLLQKAAAGDIRKSEEASTKALLERTILADETVKKKRAELAVSNMIKTNAEAEAQLERFKDPRFLKTLADAEYIKAKEEQKSAQAYAKIYGDPNLRQQMLRTELALIDKEIALVQMKAQYGLTPEHIIRQTVLQLQMLGQEAVNLNQKIQAAMNPMVRDQTNQNAALNGMLQTAQLMTSMSQTLMQRFWVDLPQAVQSFTSSFSSGITQVLMGTKTLGDFWRDMLAQMLEGIVNFFIRWAVERAAAYLLDLVLGEAMLAATTASATAAAAAMEAAWTPAAVAANMATFGGASLWAPITVGLIKATGAIGKLGGLLKFHEGGMFGGSPASIGSMKALKPNEGLAILEKGELIVRKEDTAATLAAMMASGIPLPNGVFHDGGVYGYQNARVATDNVTSSDFRRNGVEVINYFNWEDVDRHLQRNPDAVVNVIVENERGNGAVRRMVRGRGR